jgi:hypothetical protein
LALTGRFSRRRARRFEFTRIATSHRDVASRRRIATRDGDDATRCDMARNEGNRDEAR